MSEHKQFTAEGFIEAVAVKLFEGLPNAGFLINKTWYNLRDPGNDALALQDIADKFGKDSYVEITYHLEGKNHLIDSIDFKKTPFNAREKCVSTSPPSLKRTFLSSDPQTRTAIALESIATSLKHLVACKENDGGSQ